MRMKILLVEDSDMDAELAIHALRRGGFVGEIVRAVDGGVALWHLAVCQDFNLVLLDLKLRVVGGFEFLTMLHDNPKLAGIPVIILSGTLDPLDRQRARELGAADFVQKYPDLSLLSRALADAIGLLTNTPDSDENPKSARSRSL